LKATLFATLALVVLVAVGAIAIALLLSLDINQYRGQIADAIKQVTGRELILSGPMRLDIGLRLKVRADDVSLANAPWGTRPLMLSFRHVEGQIRLLPLLAGRLEIARVSLDGANLLLETNSAGAANWVLGTGGEKTSTPLVPEIDAVTVTDSRVTYRDAISGRQTVFILQRMLVETASFDGKRGLQGKLQARWNGLPLAVTAQLGTISELFGGIRPYPVDLELRAAGLTGHIQGTVEKPRAASGFAFEFDLNGADLTGLRAFLVPELAPGLPVRAHGRLSGEARLLKVNDLALSLGDIDLAGTLAVDLGAPRPRVEADLTAGRLDLTQLLPPAVHPLRTVPAGARARIFARDPLAFGALKAFDAKLKLQVKALVAPKLRAERIALELSLRDGRLRLEPLRATVASSAVTGTVSLDGAADPPRLRARLQAPGLNLARLLRETRFAGTLEGTADAFVDVAARGRSMAELMAGLQGQSRILMGRGRARTRAIDSAVGGVTAVVGMLSSGNSPMTRVNCAASSWRIKHGIATSRVMLVDTRYSTVIGRGHVDLGRETLDLEITPKAKSATLNASLPVEIGGTLASPRFTPDKLSAARRIGGLVGLVVFPPAAIAAFADLGSGDDNPCLSLARGTQQRAARQPSTPPAKPKSKVSIRKRAENIVESVGKGLKGLFEFGSNSGAVQNQGFNENSR